MALTGSKKESETGFTVKMITKMQKYDGVGDVIYGVPKDLSI